MTGPPGKVRQSARLRVPAGAVGHGTYVPRLMHGTGRAGITES